MTRDLITIHLERAFEQSGCPICRLKVETEQRYLFSFLWENVNDPAIRDRLRLSLGYCHRHAWALVDTELKAWGGGLGTGILYDDLAQGVAAGLSELLARELELSGQRPRGRLRAAATRLGHRVLTLLEGPLGKLGRSDGSLSQLPRELLPQTECPACAQVRYSEATDLQWLVRECSNPDFREKYRSSDGMCLPHLRTALDIAGDGATAAFLLQVAQERLTPLRHDLSEYLRKFNYQYRDEPKTAAEQASWRRMVAFLIGEHDL